MKILDGLVISEASIEAYYLEQAKAQKLKFAKAKSAQKRTYASTKNGTCKALPKSVFTPSAKSTRWAQLAIGTQNTFNKNCDQTTARPKASLGDRRIMRDIANMSEADKLYNIPESCPKNGRYNFVQDMKPIFEELLRLKIYRTQVEAETACGPKMSGKEYQNLRRALSKGQHDIVTKILTRNIKNNQIK